MAAHDESLFRHRLGYVILAALLCFSAVQVVLKELWYFDFWDYAAFVRELLDHPLRPQEPLVRGENTLMPYWPYLYLVSLIVHVSGAAIPLVLSAMGIVNLCFFLWTFRLFCERVFQTTEICFYALATCLVLWGTNPWFQSNFFHVFGLPYILSYPATFAMAINFLALVRYQNLLKRRNFLEFVFVTGLSTCSILVHPITSIFLFVGFCAFTVTDNNRSFQFRIAILFLVNVLLLFAVTAERKRWFADFSLAGLAIFLVVVTTPLAGTVVGYRRHYYKDPLMYIQELEPRSKRILISTLPDAERKGMAPWSYLVAYYYGYDESRYQYQRVTEDQISTLDVGYLISRKRELSENYTNLNQLKTFRSGISVYVK